MINLEQLLVKYEDILKEEVNVKELGIFMAQGPIVKIYKPLGSQLSAKFWKDTGQIIANGKKGNVREKEIWIEVFNDQGQSRDLAPEDYEVVYEGLEGDDVTVEGNTIVKMDLEITPELEKEGIAREISRFLNQMRKDADFPVEARVHLKYQTESGELKNIMQSFSTFLQDEALLCSFEEWTPEGESIATFENEKGKIMISLQR